MSERIVPSSVDPSNVDPNATSSPARPVARPGHVRAAGLLLAAGATAWAASTVIVGDKIKDGIHDLDTITGMVFVAGLLAFVRLVAVTRGAGDGWTRIIPHGLLVVLAGAFLLNALSFGYARHDDFPLPLMILDACWPLGQLGMLVLGVVIAVKGRYRGALRWLPLLAGAWFPVTMAADLAGGSAVSVYVSAAWLLGMHAHLGVRLAARPAL
ncbi:hypothetical protein SMD20_09280 [Nonomuraea sp. LP-02]|uniref:hypothetical protein n=1 Tax=Nonomuraea sp. LP-02 TaxID=3097960 RepID=UPI002E30B4FE|nr:hypothetical protein [Nonomuraea sp. LP-02]MED7924422.1 hypothetical protein [Nonomuraea sp. LP-02]